MVDSYDIAKLSKDQVISLFRKSEKIRKRQAKIIEELEKEINECDNFVINKLMEDI